MRLTLLGLFFIALGVLYLRRPTLFRRGIWLKTSVAIRLLSEQNYTKYVKSLGIVLIVVGVGLVAWEQGLGRLFAQA
jgi:uncharacterized membrane protein YidH (DUF202 family)